MNGTVYTDSPDGNFVKSNGDGSSVHYGKDGVITVVNKNGVQMYLSSDWAKLIEFTSAFQLSASLSRASGRSSAAPTATSRW